jgi:hypothetical protein
VQKILPVHNLEFNSTINKNSTICKVKKFKDDDRPLLLKHIGYATIGKTLIIVPAKDKKKEISKWDSETSNWRLVENIVLNRY